MRSLLAAALLVGSLLLGLTPSRPAEATSPSISVEAEKMTITPGAGGPFVDPSASGGAGLLLWSNGAATATVEAPAPVIAVSVTARGDHCEGGPNMDIRLDGARISSGEVRSTSTWGTRIVPVSAGGGTRRIEVAFTNDHLTTSCDRNLRLDRVTLVLATTTTTAAPTTTTTAAPTTTTTAAPANPVARLPLHVGSSTSAGEAAQQLRATRPDDAARLDLLAATPTARWFGEWSGDIRAATSSHVGEAAAVGRLPVLVAYAIPLRDCSSYSGGGMTSANAYRTWIRQFAEGIGNRPAVVILEPDAVALTECLKPPARNERNALLSDAIAVLSANPATTVYLDAGHAGWHTPDVMAARLRAAGVDRARGVSLNVSNFGSTSGEVAYARALHERLGTRAVIDTGRNGKGSNGEWCNPVGRAIGDRPTTATASSIVDAYLWIKVPGESDGTCNGGPPAGRFWIDYAVALVRNAGH